MSLSQVAVAPLRQAEKCRAVLYRTGVGTPVDGSIFSHGLYQVKDLLAIWTGAIFNRGLVLIDLQMLKQCLFGMIPLITTGTVVLVMQATIRLQMQATANDKASDWSLAPKKSDEKYILSPFHNEPSDRMIVLTSDHHYT